MSIIVNLFYLSLFVSPIYCIKGVRLALVNVNGIQEAKSGENKTVFYKPGEPVAITCKRECEKTGGMMLINHYYANGTHKGFQLFPTGSNHRYNLLKTSEIPFVYSTCTFISMQLHKTSATIYYRLLNDEKADDNATKHTDNTSKCIITELNNTSNYVKNITNACSDTLILNAEIKNETAQLLALNDDIKLASTQILESIENLTRNMPILFTRSLNLDIYNEISENQSKLFAVNKELKTQNSEIQKLVLDVKTKCLELLRNESDSNEKPYYTKLKSVIEVLRIDAADMLAFTKQLNDKNSELIAYVLEVKNKQSELLESTADAKNRSKEMQKQNSDVLAALVEMQKQDAENSASNLEVRKLISELSASNDVMRKQHERAMKQNEEMNTQNEQMKKQNDEIKKQNEEMKTQNEEMKTQNKEMKTKNKEMKKQNEEMMKTINELQASIEELKQDNNKMQSLTKDLGVTNAEMKQQNEAIMKDTEKIKHSLEKLLGLALDERFGETQK